MFDNHRTCARFDADRTMSRIPAPLYSITAALAWGGMFPVADHAFGSGLDPFNLTAIRYVGASVIFVLVLLAIEGRGALRTEGRTRELLVLGSLGFAGFNLFAFVGLAHTEPQNAAIIVPTMPLVTLLVRWARDGARPDPATMTAIAVALAGVILVVTHGDPARLSGSFGDLLVLLGVVCFVLYTLGAARFEGWSSLRYTAISAPLGTLTIVVATVIADVAGWQTLPSGGDVGATVPEIAYVVVFGAVVAVVAWNLGVRLLGPATATLFITLVPVTTFAVRIAEGYSPGAAELIGTALVVAALIGANIASRVPTQLRVTRYVSAA
jgi:drug/metabolite transporter (DMT)-like permease